MAAPTSRRSTQKDQDSTSEKPPVVTAVYSNYTQFFEIKSDGTGAESDPGRPVPPDCAGDSEEASLQLPASPDFTQLCTEIKSEDLSLTVDQELGADCSNLFGGHSADLTLQQKSQECAAVSDLPQTELSVNYQPVSIVNKPMEFVCKCPCGNVGRKVITIPRLDYVHVPSSAIEPGNLSTVPLEMPNSPMEVNETTPTNPMEVNEATPTITMEGTETTSTNPMEGTETTSTNPVEETETTPTNPMEGTETTPIQPPESTSEILNGESDVEMIDAGPEPVELKSDSRMVSYEFYILTPGSRPLQLC
jgi:hypothetical protein